MTGNALYDELDRLRGVVSEQIEEIFSLKGEINDLVVKQTCRSEYEDVGASIGVTVAAKQKAYGDSFGKAGGLLRILYPDGISPKQYDDALAVTRIIDKLFRIATDKDALGESPYHDIAGYGILGSMSLQEGLDLGIL
ncbi:MAG: hypothetical protein JRD89_18365 [Deltaproteobacteria bacterium]|nr:hypothetical protein [Deltaproteobacteria bacterium]